MAIHKYTHFDEIVRDDLGGDRHGNGYFNCLKQLKSIPAERYPYHPRREGKNQLRHPTVTESLEASVREFKSRRREFQEGLRKCAERRVWSEELFKIHGEYMELTSGGTCSGLAYNQGARKFTVVPICDNLINADNLKPEQKYIELENEPEGVKATPETLNDVLWEVFFNQALRDGLLDVISSQSGRSKLLLSHDAAGLYFINDTRKHKSTFVLSMISCNDLSTPERLLFYPLYCSGNMKLISIPT